MVSLPMGWGRSHCTVSAYRGVLPRCGMSGDVTVTGKVASVVCFAGRSCLLVLPFGATLQEG